MKIFVAVSVHCQPERFWSHLGNGLLGMPGRNDLDCVSWSLKTSLLCVAPVPDWGPRLCKVACIRTLCLLIVEVVWPAVPCSQCSPFPPWRTVFSNRDPERALSLLHGFCQSVLLMCQERLGQCWGCVLSWKEVSWLQGCVCIALAPTCQEFRHLTSFPLSANTQKFP